MKAMLIGLVPGAMLIGLGAGCTVGDVASNEKRATAALEAKSASTVNGTAMFTSSGTNVKLTLTVTGASPGQHGVHLHAVGDCTAENASSAMGHWDPTTMVHGLPTAGVAHHLGDCGNITVGADGTGKLEITNAWTIGTGEMTDIIGKAVIVHAAVDDGTSPPAPATPGNSGARQACGVIAAQ